MVIVVDHEGSLRAVDWADQAVRMLSLLRRHYGKNGFTLEAAQNPGGLTQTMKSYFAGELSSIDSVPTQTAGTPFQREVWRSLREIPCGLTISYRALPNRTGRPKPERAICR